ncbi:MAG: recombination-associated protein RdgC [Burkholderiaceae bacterium]
MWFKNLRVFRLSPRWSCSLDMLESALEKQAFTPGSSREMIRLGWVPPRQDTGLVYAANGHYMLSLRAEKKLLPTTVINQVTRAKALDIEEQQGYKPGRKQLKEIKEQVTDELLPKAFSLFKDTRVWIDTQNHWLVIDAAAAAKSDEVLGMLAKVLDPFPVTPLHVNVSPGSAMTSWLIDETPPDGFSIDQDTELRATNESRATVRYVRHSLDIDDIRKHVESGKQCTRLAMTWADRVSFVLTDGLDIKRVSPLDVLKENQDAMAANEAELFDADFALMTGELGKLLDDLVQALGGERTA